MFNYLNKVNQYGIVRSFYIFLNYFFLPSLKGTLFPLFFKVDKFGKQIKIHSNVEIKNPHVSFGNDVILGKQVVLEGEGEISVGNGTGIGPYTWIVSINKVNIGKNCQISSFCYFIDHDHYFKKSKVPYAKQTNFKNDFKKSKKIEIGDNVWIGTHVIILKGVKIGKGSIIGAGSVVTKNIPEYSIAVGNPAKVIKKIK